MLENIPSVSGKGTGGNEQHFQPKPRSQPCSAGDSPRAHSSAGSTHIHLTAASAANHPWEMPGQGTARRHPSQGARQRGRPGSPLPGQEQVGVFMAKKARLPSPRSRAPALQLNRGRKVLSNTAAFLLLTIALTTQALVLVQIHPRQP